MRRKVTDDESMLMYCTQMSGSSQFGEIWCEKKGLYT